MFFEELINSVNRIFVSQNFKNSFWSVLDVVIYPIIMLLATPFFLKKLGPDLYGMWMLINSFITSIGIFNLGLGDASIKFISKYRGLNDIAGIKRVANSTFTTFLILTFLIVIIGLVVLLLLESYHIQIFSSQITSQNVTTLNKLLKIALIIFGLKLIEQNFLSIFKGFERFDLFSKVSILSKTATTLINISLVYLDFGLITIFEFLILIQFLFILLEYVIIKKFYPDFSLGILWDYFTFKETFSFGIWAWVQGIISIIAGQLDKFLVTYLAGVSTLAYYSLAFTFANQIYSLFTAASGWIFPYISKNILSNIDIKPLFNKMQLVILTSGFLVISITFLFRNHILNLWLGPKVTPSVVYFLEGFLFLNIFNLLSIVPSFVLSGANYMRLITLNMIISITFTILFVFILYQTIGNIGLVYGKVLSSVLTIPFFVSYVYGKVFKANLVDIILIVILPFLMASILYVESYYSLLFLIALLFIVSKLYRELNLKLYKH